MSRLLLLLALTLALCVVTTHAGGKPTTAPLLKRLRREEPNAPASNTVEDTDEAPVQIEDSLYLNTFSKALVRFFSAFKMLSVSDEAPKYGHFFKAFVADSDSENEIEPSSAKQIAENVALTPTQKQDLISIGGGLGGLLNPNAGLAGIIGFFALVGASAAALIGFLVPPLQIANQVLSIIALAMLAAYVFEDKHYAHSHFGYGGHDAYYGAGGYDDAYGYADTGYSNSYSGKDNSYSDPHYDSYKRLGVAAAAADSENMMHHEEYVH